MKKTIIVMFTLSIIFLNAFSTNQANAAVGIKEVEVTFEYGCGLAPVNLEPTLFPSPVTFKATIPDKVAKGEEFYLTNTSVSLTLPFNHPDAAPPADASLEGPNFKISYGNENSVVHTFLPDLDIVIPPGINYDYPVMISEGTDVGPFIADEDNEIILRADEIRMNLKINLGAGIPLSLSLMCLVPENEEFEIFTVPIDSEAPVITLNGDNPMIVKQGDHYVEPGATAVDNFDGNLSEDEIEISGEVDTSTIGEYTITYTASDSVGNEATVERIVEVVEPFGSWYTGEGAPSDELGSNGDSYLDLSTGDVYKRDPNTWNLAGNLKGDDGKQGSEVITGSGAPSADVGDVGDLYLDTATGDVYKKTASGWDKIANLQGPAGPTGPQGPKGEPGSGGGGGDGSGQKSDDGKGSSGKGGKLPKTATSLPTLMFIGSLLIVAGGVLFLRRRKAIE